MLLATSVRAEGPYSNFLIGQRSPGLGGAYVAVADDTSATFHNPAGVAGITESSAGASVWTLISGNRTLDPGYVTELGPAPLEHAASRSLPLFLAAVVKFGKRNRRRVRRHAVGASIVHPHSDAYRFVTQLVGDGDEAADRLEVRHDDRSAWYGLSYGYLFKPGVSLGASLYYSRRSLSHDEVEIQARTSQSVSAPDLQFTRALSLDAGADHLIARVGTLMDLTDTLRLGMMFQLPGIEVSNDARAEGLSSVAGGAGPTTLQTFDVDGMGANLQVPVELRAGLAWRPAKATLLSLDISGFGPVGDAGNPLPLVERRGKTVELGAFVPEATYREPTLHGALGFEYVVLDKVPLRGGVFYERSSAPDIPDTSDVHVRDQFDTLGTSIAIGIPAWGYDMSFALTALFENGQGLGLSRSNPGAPAAYAAADGSAQTYIIHIGGAKSIAKGLVKAIVE